MPWNFCHLNCNIEHLKERKMPAKSKNSSDKKITNATMQASDYVNIRLLLIYELQYSSSSMQPYKHPNACTQMMHKYARHIHTCIQHKRYSKSFHIHAHTHTHVSRLAANAALCMNIPFSYKSFIRMCCCRCHCRRYICYRCILICMYNFSSRFDVAACFDVSSCVWFFSFSVNFCLYDTLAHIHIYMSSYH